MLRGDGKLNHLYIPWGGMLCKYSVFVNIGSTFILRFGCIVFIKHELHEYKRSLLE